MEQAVLVPSSVCNKNLNTQSATKQELQNYQALERPMYQIDSNRKKTTKFFCHSRLFKRLSLVFSTYQALKNTENVLDGEETGVLLSDFTQQLRSKNANVLDI